MNAVGRVGSFFAQSVYTVSGPFHPFGGAVDIIVVQQEDGTFKTSPWYVKFGKFQGVLKRTEKKVVVAVNGSDASFHMHLDHKGEAYFLKDSPQGEDVVLALPSPEAASSGDEFSHPTLAIEYPKGEEEGADARVDHGKEESEDERGDDLELRFEGREASKQLIQQSVEERAAIAAAAAEETEPPEVNMDSELATAEEAEPSEGNINSELATAEETEPPKANISSELATAEETEPPEANMNSELAKAEEIEPPRVNFKSEVEVVQIPNIAEQGSGNFPALENSHIVELLPEAASEQIDPEKSDSNVQVSLPPTNEDSGLKLISKSPPARALLAQAVLAALNPPASPQMEDPTTIAPVLETTAPVPDITAPVAETTASVPETAASSPERRKNRNNGLLIHGLLNQAVGLPPNQSSGLASALIATAALQSLRRVLSDGTTPPLPEKSEDQSVVPVGPSAVLGGELSQQIPGVASLLNPVAVDSLPSYEGSLRDLMVPTTFSSSGGVQSESAEPLLIDFPSRSPRSPRLGLFEHGKVLDVTRVDVVDDSVVVEVVTHDDGKDSSGSMTPEREGGSPFSDSNVRKEKIVIDRKEILEKVLHLQDEENFHGKAGTETAENFGGVHEKGTQQPEEVVTVNVDKHLLDNLNEAMLETDARSPHVVLTDEKDIAAVVGKDEGQIGSEEVAIVSKEEDEIGSKSMNSVPMHELTPAAIDSKEGEEIGSKNTNSVPLHELTPAGKELALVNLADVGSPRLKAALELELAWRCVIENASTSLKVTPYTSKSIHSTSFNKQLSSTSDNGKKSRDGMLPEQAEKKTWGGWFWGSAPPSKRSSEPNSMEGLKSKRAESNPELRVPHLGKEESGEQSGPMLDGDSGSSSRSHDGKGQSGEKLVQIGRDPGVEDHVDSEGNVQQKGSDMPAPRRRSIFGLLSRTTSNQSSLSTVSSLQRGDDVQPVGDALKREDSLERAEILVDLLEEKWARGTEASKNMMAVTRGSGAKVPKDGRHRKVTNENSEVKNVGVVFQQVDAEGNCQPIMVPGDGISGHELVDEHKLSHGDSDSVGADAVVRQVMRKPEEGVSQRLLEAEGTGGHQHEAELATGGAEVEHTATGVESDRGQGEFSSSPQVILMRVNGHLVTAPLLPVEDELLRDFPESNEVTANDGVANGRPFHSMQEPVVCLVDGPDGRLVQTSSSPELRRDEEELHHTPSDTLPELDGSVRNDSKEDIEETHSCRGSSALDELETDDSFGQSQTKVETLQSFDGNRSAGEWPSDKSGPTLENKVFLGIGNADRGIVDSKETEGLKWVGTLAFDQLDERNDDGVAEVDELGMERYYSSKDLTVLEESGEKKGMKRNMSEYMDAIAADDEQESDGSGHEKEASQMRVVSSPIGIPGASEQIRSYHSLDNIYLPRTNSESLPNVRHLVVGDSEMSSPRLQLSRSLDSPLPKLLPSVDSVAPTGASDSTMFTGLERVTDSSIQPERAIEKVDEKPIIGRTPSVPSSSKNGGEKYLETGFELSVCRQQLTEKMGLDAAAQVFDSAKVSLEEFKNAGSLIAINENLVVRVGGGYYPWAVAAPIVLGILAFGQVLIAPNEGAIPVEKAVVEVDRNGTSQALTSNSSGAWFWPFGGSRGGSRVSKTPEKEMATVTAALMSRDALELATQAALKSRLTEEVLRMNGFYKRQRKVRTNSPSSQQLASLNLKEGSNSITFTFQTRMLGKQQVHARIFLWQWNTRIVISDVDGTITKSDVLGQFMPLVGKDWTQSGVARLFSAIKKNGYELLFLSARAISQSHITRQFLENIKQDGEGLPHGPVVISPDGLFPSLYREVIRRAPHEFKIACLEDIKSLFPPESKPFYAGFGNRDTDELSYLKVGISKGKIFIINPKGEVIVNNRVDVKSYTSLHKLVDDMFPAMTFTEQEDYNEWNFWKLPLPDVDDSPSILSLGGPSSKRSGKGSSGRRS